MEPLKYRKWGGDQVAKPGDWLVFSNDSTYTIDADEFEKTYERVSDGVYQKSSLTYARELVGNGSWPTLEGDSDYSEGDYLCASNPKMNDAYPVDRGVFLDTYRSANGESASDEDDLVDPLIPLLDAVRGWVSNSGVDASKVIDAARPWANAGYPGIGGLRPLESKIQRLRDETRDLSDTLERSTDSVIETASKLREATERADSAQEKLDCLTRMLNRAQDLGAIEWSMEAESIGISVPSVGRAQELEKENEMLRIKTDCADGRHAPWCREWDKMKTERDQFGELCGKYEEKFKMQRAIIMDSPDEVRRLSLSFFDALDDADGAVETKVSPSQGWTVHRGSGWRCGYSQLGIECGKPADWLGNDTLWRCEEHVPRMSTVVVTNADAPKDAGWFATEERVERLQKLVGNVSPEYLEGAIYRELRSAHYEWRASLEDLRDNAAATNRLCGEGVDELVEDRDLLVAALQRILNLPTDGPHNDYDELIGAMQHEAHVACTRLEVRRHQKLAARRSES
ncbi:MAG: hypothetical protein DRH30_10435 [Deltaproteobacteria bacterium]|nr:MAG: hypothetical protein DRH30_10435 [Deltaproteobacteria bacterium]